MFATLAKLSGDHRETFTEISQNYHIVYFAWKIGSAGDTFVK